MKRQRELIEEERAFSQRVMHPAVLRPIIDMVDEAVATSAPEYEPLQLCARRSLVTASVLSTLTRRRDIGITVGSFFARVADDDELLVGWPRDFGQLQEMHVWVVVGNEFLDPSTRHLPAYVAMMGATWRRPVLPFALGSGPALYLQGYDYRPHREAFEYMSRRLGDEEAYAKTLAHGVLDRLVARRRSN